MNEQDNQGRGQAEEDGQNQGQRGSAHNQGGGEEEACASKKGKGNKLSIGGK